MNTIDEVKSAPLANSDFANAEAAYEHEELITPKNEDFDRVPGR
jgi:hypothetical protein